MDGLFRFKSSEPTLKKPNRLRLETLEPRHLLAGVVINELHYDPDNSLERVEFIELHNATDLSVDISGWRIDEGVDYQFPPGSVIEARGYVVVAQNSDDFETKFGFAPFGEWQDGDRLKNSGERVELLDANGTEIDELRFRLGFPWPTPADGESIELINPNLENDEGGAWRSSLADSSIIQENSVWRYRKGISNNPPAGWNNVGFDESSDNVTWQDGTSTIGYGDGDDTTLLSDMRNGYTSVYFRRDFELGGAIPNSLNLRLYVDDGAIIYVNGTEVRRAHVSSGTKNYNSTSGVSHEASWEDITLNGLSNILQPGTNTIAFHGLNQNANSSDFSFNAALQSSGNTVSPGAQNTAYADNAPPLIEDVEHSPKQPASDQEVVITAKIEDDQGVASATLEYQLVAPGDYIEIGDPRYATSWTSLAMRNDGLGNDEEAGDRTYTVTLPAALQEHRQLVRYRIVATDSLGDTVQIPYADDPQPNFAYFVYDQTPDWTGAVRPGVTQAETYSSELLDSVATYHLITTRQDHEDAQHIPNSPTGSYGGSEYRWQGTLVYDGEVYDHVRYRARGGVWRYSMGKNMWKFDFNRGHDFFAKDNYGNEYEVGWDKLNLGANIQQGDFWHRGEQGMFESVGFKLFNLAGVEAPNTNHVHFRIVENADENGADQYSGDFQGMYLATEQMDGQFLEQHGLPDGNLYKMENGTGVGGIGGDLNNQGDWPEPQDSSDLIEFKQTYESGAQSAEWWKANFNLDSYYSYRTIVEGIHHYDIANGKNYFYYHNPETDKWETLPWDLDLTWANNMFGSGNEPFRTRVLAIPEFAQGYRNRVRELRDLLYNEDQAYSVIDEMASFVYTSGQQSLVDADRAMWDYNPILVSSYVRSSKAGHGRFYAGGGGVPATNSFEGMLNKMKTYIRSRINLFDNSILNDDAQLPEKPILFTTTPSTYPVDLLGFATNAYDDPQNDAFAAMEYRIGEVANPGISTFTSGDEWKYEIDAVWESGELTTYTNSIQVDSSEITPGKTYRARARWKDAAGHWSHWSDAIEFVAGAPIVTTLAVTEIHYHPDNPSLPDENQQEFIEILNIGANPVDLTGAQIVDFASTPYNFDPGTSIQPGQYLVVARNPDVFSAIYGHANVAESGYANRNLGNGGDTVTILDSSGAQVLSFTYDDTAPWPTASDGDGPSLELIDPLADPTDPSNWRASANDGGSPSRSNDPFLPGDYDRNGTVEQADFDLWRNEFGNVVLNPGDGADGNLNMVIDAADFTVWRDNLGATFGDDDPPVIPGTKSNWLSQGMFQALPLGMSDRSERSESRRPAQRSLSDFFNTTRRDADSEFRSRLIERVFADD